MSLSERQQREIAYHREHAARHRNLIVGPFSYEVLYGTRWWNAYWHMFDMLRRQSVARMKILVVGCGFGDDALRLAKMGGEVYAFDLSPESVGIARELAHREGLAIDFRQLPAERTDYPAASFIGSCAGHFAPCGNFAMLT